MDPIAIRTGGLAPRAANSQPTLGQADFLRLLTSQLANQSPLDPMDNEAFVAQMAQFSAVSGIGEMNQTLQGLRDDLSARRLSDAAAFIGREAHVPAGAVTPGPSGVAAVLDLGSAADAVRVEVLDDAGRTVRTLTLGPQSAGQVPIVWDGADETGAAAKGGPFQLRALAVSGDSRTEAPLYVAGRVNAVTTTGGTLLLDIEGIGRMPPSSVFKLT